MYMIHGEQAFINWVRDIWSVMTKWDRTPHFHLNGPSESVRVETKSFEADPPELARPPFFNLASYSTSRILGFLVVTMGTAMSTLQGHYEYKRENVKFLTLKRFSINGSNILILELFLFTLKFLVLIPSSLSKVAQYAGSGVRGSSGGEAVSE